MKWTYRINNHFVLPELEKIVIILLVICKYRIEYCIDCLIYVVSSKLCKYYTVLRKFFNDGFVPFGLAWVYSNGCSVPFNKKLKDLWFLF